MPILDSKGKKIEFPDTMHPDEIRSVLKVIEQPGKYANLKSENKIFSESLKKLFDTTKAIELNESAIRELCTTLVNCMETLQKQNAALLKTLKAGKTEVTLNAPEPAKTEVTLNAPEIVPPSYNFNVIRDRNGYMSSVEVIPLKKG